MAIRNMAFRKTRRARRGLSLLELLLALALAGMILTAVGMAIDLHLRMLDVRRTSVEEAQLARAVLRMIADDLRGAVRKAELDVSAVSGSDSAAGALDSEGEETTEGEDTETTDELTDEPVSIADSVAPPATPGLYGNSLEMQVDVSRLPRLDEMQALLNPEAAMFSTDILSDVKTIAYYVAPPNTTIDPNAASGGLVRRVLDRAVTSYAADYGDLTFAESAGEVIAPEVTSITFQYFDGLAWYPEWDSEVFGGLPMAVEIIITITPEEYSRPDRLIALPSRTSQKTLQPQTYRLVVRLPAAEPIMPEEEMETDTLGTGL